MKKIKFNIIDFLVILAIVLVAVAGVYILGSKSETVVNTEKTKVLVAIEQKNVDVATMEYYDQNDLTGNVVNVGVREKTAGVIKGVEISNAKEEVFNQKTGETELVDKKDRYDLVFKIEVELDETDKDFLLGTDKIKIGKALNFNGKGCSGYGNVVIIEKVGGEK